MLPGASVPRRFESGTLNSRRAGPVMWFALLAGRRSAHLAGSGHSGGNCPWRCAPNFEICFSLSRRLRSGRETWDLVWKRFTVEQPAKLTAWKLFFVTTSIKAASYVGLASNGKPHQSNLIAVLTVDIPNWLARD